MTAPPILNLEALATLIDQRISRMERPIWVSQRNVEAVVGLPRRTFLRLARDGDLASRRVYRLVLARVVDVDAWIAKQGPKPDTHDADEAKALARAGLRRVRK